MRYQPNARCAVGAISQRSNPDCRRDWVDLDHNYFAYVGDLLACFLAPDDDYQQQHMNYIINRFLLEESLQFNADERTDGLLHSVMTDPGARSAAKSRLMYLINGLQSSDKQADSFGADNLTPSPAQLQTWLSAPGSEDLDHGILEEFLCDNIAAEALGTAAARSSGSIDLVAHDLVFPIDAGFMIMWFWEALRFRLAALFDDEGALSDDGQEVARTRGHYFSFQFLVSYLVTSGASADHIQVHMMESAQRADDLMVWLNDNLEGAQSDDNLEAVVKLGARNCAVFGLRAGRLHTAVRTALGWRI